MPAPTGDFAVSWTGLSASNPYTPPNFTNIDTSRTLQALGSGNGLKPSSVYSAIMRWRYNGTMQSSPAYIRSKIEIGTANSSDLIECGIYDSSGNGYLLEVSSTNVSIKSVNAAGTEAGLTSGTAAGAASGDIFMLELNTSTHGLVAYRNGTSIVSTSDSTYTTGLAFGFGFNPGNNNSSNALAFAGDGAVTSNATIAWIV